MTTRHNLSEKYLKRLRMIRALNETITTLGTKGGSLTPAEKRSLTIAFRNIRRAADDARRIYNQLQELS